jgi:CRP-like cAMP-binding protein
MPLGKILYERGDALRHVYFPTDCIVSFLYVLEDGSTAEICVVGNDGMVGVSLFMGGEKTTSRAIVQSSGSAYRLKGTRLTQEFERQGETMHILLRYTQALIRWRRPRSATGITPWTSSCAAGCSCLSTGCRTTN